MTAAERALDFVKAGDRIGLGTGHAAAAFAVALAGRVRRGLRVVAVPTSEATSGHARDLGIPLTGLDEVERLDVTVDGADEVDPQLDLIKGYGGALLREKVIATTSRRLVILVGREKLVPVLGTRGTLPVEVVPFALPVCRRRLADLGIGSALRPDGNRPFVTDNGNYVLDCAVGPMAHPRDVLRDIRAIAGIVEVGLFLGLADIVLVEDDGRVEVLERAPGTRSVPRNCTVRECES
jgi:ribose 5-phosphate isomerase A